MSTTIIFDVSSPDLSLQYKVFKSLCEIKSPRLSHIPEIQQTEMVNPLIVFGHGYRNVMQAVIKADRSTSWLHVSNGLFSELYIKIMSLSLPGGAEAFRFAMEEVMKRVRVVHIHIKSDPSNLNSKVRRGLLSGLHADLKQSDSNKWFYFEEPNIPLIQKLIVDFAES